MPLKNFKLFCYDAVSTVFHTKDQYASDIITKNTKKNY